MDIAEQNPSIVSEGFPSFFFLLVDVFFVEFVSLSQFILFFMATKELFAVSYQSSLITTSRHYATSRKVSGSITDKVI
jgi:hypothetical protein